CRALSQGAGLEDVPGIMYRHNREIIVTSTRSNIENLDIIPFPAWELLPMEIYLKNPIWGDVASNSSGFRKDINVRYEITF
ncbi:MAG: hypothetical protein MUO88_03570, partial [Desulfobacterales bacterium]|nr:hypothetical protein [Desulfobacterales bacterium]